MWVITGANGFIGSAVVAGLNQLGHDDLILVDSVSLEKRAELLIGKRYKRFLQTNDLVTYLRHSAADLAGIVHMGACSSTTEMNVEFLKQTNTDYTRSLFELCRDRRVPFIYASSGAVYGGGAQGFDDGVSSTMYKPLNPYGWSKINFDLWAEKQTATPPRWYGLRFFNVYGPNENFKGDMSSVVFKAFQQIRNTGRLRLFRSHRPEYKDGEQLRDFVYVKDIISWIIDLMEKPVASGIYNMGYGKARTWLDLAKAVFSEMDRPMNIEWIDIPANIREQYQYLTEAKMNRWTTASGATPKWDLEAGVKDYVGGFLLANRYL